MQNVDILLVEDNEADIVLMKEALKDAQVTNAVHVVRDGEDAIRFLECDPAVNPDGSVPGLILLDLYMPKKDGMDVLRYLKDDETLRKIPAVMMTSSREESDMLRAYDLQANAYVVKPVDFEQLLDVTHRIENFWLGTASLPSHPNDGTPGKH